VVHHLGTQPQLVAEDVRHGFYARERTRAVAGVVLYAVGAVLGVVAATGVALAIFLALPVFYGITSHGLTVLPRWLRWVLPRH
jgi:hypothetical protein